MLLSCTNRISNDIVSYTLQNNSTNNKIITHYNEYNILIKEEIFDVNEQILTINEYDYNIKRIKNFYANQKIKSEQTYRLIRIKNKKNKEHEEYLKQYTNQHVPWSDLMNNMNIETSDVMGIIEIDNIKEVKIANMNNWNDFNSDYGFLIKDGRWINYNLDGSMEEISFYNRGFLEQKITYDKNNVMKIHNYNNEENFID